MQTEISKAELLNILEENRGQHKAIFDEAVEGYKAEALKQLEAHIERIKKGKMVVVQVYLPVPEEHTRDYDRAIKMVQLHQGETIVLTEGDVGQYVMDDWAWKRNFLASNSGYSQTAAASLGE